MIRRFADWLDRQTGIRRLLQAALDEPIPGGASFAYVFGSGLLFLFISQVVTGVFLALYYVPSADHAHHRGAVLHHRYLRSSDPLAFSRLPARERVCR